MQFFSFVPVKKYVGWLRCRLSNREISFMRMHTQCCCRRYCLSAVCYYCCWFSFCYVTPCAVSQQSTRTWYMIKFILFVRCCTTYEYVFVYTCLLLLCSVLLYCCCCSSCCVLLLFVIVCRMATFVAVVHCIWLQCFRSLHSNTSFVPCAPWQYCRIYSVRFLPKIHIYHTSSVLWACAEPRQALARRGGAPPVSHTYMMSKSTLCSLFVPVYNR